MRISDWSSDVCSSDLALEVGHHIFRQPPGDGCFQLGRVRILASLQFCEIVFGFHDVPPGSNALSRWVALLAEMMRRTSPCSRSQWQTMRQLALERRPNSTNRTSRSEDLR